MSSTILSHHLITEIKNCATLVLATICVVVVVTPSNGYLNINRENIFWNCLIFITNTRAVICIFVWYKSYCKLCRNIEYCKAWDENFQPIICIIKNASHNRPHHPPPTQYPILQPTNPDYTDSDEDEDDECSCEVTCTPRIINQRSLDMPLQVLNNSVALKRRKRTTTTSYRCRSCGTPCSVTTNRPPTCYCTVPTNRSECTCAATCAMFRNPPVYFQRNFYYDMDEANCIFTVNALEDWRLGEERPPYSCDCRRSKEAEGTNRPDFICICQRAMRDYWVMCLTWIC